jgi:hypothetical protein
LVGRGQLLVSSFNFAQALVERPCGIFLLDRLIHYALDPISNPRLPGRRGAATEGCEMIVDVHTHFFRRRATSVRPCARI